MEHKNILVKLEGRALSCNVTCSVTKKIYSYVNGFNQITQI